MFYTHALMVHIPNHVKFEKKTKLDLELARKQHEDLAETLREAGIKIIELSPEEDCVQQSLFTGDSAVCINGTALITRPYKKGSRSREISSLLNNLAWQVVEAPATAHGKEVVLEGSDVLFTGKEIFVGIRKNGTNMEGALIVGRVFADLPVIPIIVPGLLPLRHYMSMVSSDVIAVGCSKEAKQILQRMERQATSRYRTLTLEHDEAVNCMNVNGHLIYRQDVVDTKFQILREPIELFGVTVSELSKVGDPISRFCLLIRKMDHLKTLW